MCSACLIFDTHLFIFCPWTFRIAQNFWSSQVSRLCYPIHWWKTILGQVCSIGIHWKPCGTREIHILQHYGSNISILQMLHVTSATRLILWAIAPCQWHLPLPVSTIQFATDTCGSAFVCIHSHKSVVFRVLTKVLESNEIYEYSLVNSIIMRKYFCGFGNEIHFVYFQTRAKYQRSPCRTTGNHKLTIYEVVS